MKDQLNVLALEAYYGGSHKSFLDTWIANSTHRWTVYGLPPYKWKWRMRHAAVSFAEQLRPAEQLRRDANYDVIFCSDMLNLAEFRGLAPTQIANLPAVFYFHENQLTYPDRQNDRRDHHYAYSNFISAIAADAVWFNSEYHRTSWLAAITAFLRRMPDYQELDAVEQIRMKSTVRPPAIDVTARANGSRFGPLKILWLARWEADKNPDDFFAALYQLDNLGIDFRVSVLGESFQHVPPCFSAAHERLAHRIDRWGYVGNRDQYVNCLHAADVVVSTAIHEFFGIAIVEAIAAGAIPVLPQRLAYPEILATLSQPIKDQLLYSGSVPDLVQTLTHVASAIKRADWRNQCSRELAEAIRPFHISKLARSMDQALSEIAKRK